MSFGLSSSQKEHCESMAVVNRTCWLLQLTCNVINNNSYWGVANIAGNQAAKSLLRSIFGQHHVSLLWAQLCLLIKKRCIFTCPAVSHSWRRTVLSSMYIVLERKSIPMVAFWMCYCIGCVVSMALGGRSYLICVVKRIIHKASN